MQVNMLIFKFSWFYTIMEFYAEPLLQLHGTVEFCRKPSGEISHMHV